MKLEICTNSRAILGWCGLDDGFGSHAARAASREFVSGAQRSLGNAGYKVSRVKQRRNARVKSGACSRWSCGPVGSVEIPTEQQAAEITSILERCIQQAVMPSQEDVERSSLLPEVLGSIVQVRRGKKWVSGTDAGVPGWVTEAAADEIVENGRDSGQVSLGEATWAWRMAGHCSRL